MAINLHPDFQPPKQPEKRLTREDVMKRLRETDGFIDGAHLDLSCSPPDWNATPAEQETYIDMNGYVQIGKNPGEQNALKRLLKNPDSEALQMLAERDPEMARQLREEEEERVALAFLKANPNYERSDSNFAAIIKETARRVLGEEYARLDDEDDLVERLQSARQFSVENLQESYEALLAAGKLSVPAGQVKTLNEEQLRDVASVLVISGPEAAVEAYFQYSLGWFAVNQAKQFGQERDLLTDYPQVANAAARFIWEQSRTYTPSPQWEAFLQAHVSSKRLVTVAALDALYKNFLDSKKHSALFGPAMDEPEQPEEQPDFESLSDQQVNALMKDVARDRAKKRH